MDKLILILVILIINIPLAYLLYAMMFHRDDA